mmetsp:Transcript_20711/g.29529  ORF Transcript_20711/g.29529 Transcript_20711/m.29529 type:complete len:370 (+) Transcript_20711:95-1204(+)|eukprot:CAMPEP_0172423508 /NCGR_PEP_ID=MMETSP1064-20121228/17086_1 /TAXON_ID=202472 /ORGANISM="Aulacoseira subarctica , Strain CCAP 1002/5" /LENGTH=369 /DNA_ID=CAMNT_0013164921 /DNA_START=43 /DNA_END=1152 /DNA_ORIENTATION=+
MLRSRGSASSGQHNSTSSPVPFGAADLSESKSPGKRKNQNRCFLLFQVVIVLGVCCYGIKILFDKDKLNRQLMLQAEEWKAKLNKATHDLAKKEEHVQATLLASEEKWSAKLEEAKKANERLLQKQAQGKKENTNDQEKKLKRQIESLRSSALRTQQQLQKLDKQAVLDKFGPGPHRIEIELDFPPDSPMSELPSPPSKFIIELAPVDLMPHSVHLFLEQVSHHLWDGCSFMRNAGHVIQASHAPYYKNQGTREKLMDGFYKSGFTSVAFQEYHKDYPHVKYTVGFAGRPGGPDFYVSVVNNSGNHGPGGQGDYADPQEADPCFGKVVEGFDAVDRMHKMPKEPGDYEAMERNVGIASAKILPKSLWHN